MNVNDPNLGIPADVMVRYEAASEERMISHLLQSIRTLNEERGGKLKPGSLARAASGVITLRELNKIAQRLGLEPHITFRPRILRATVDRKEEL